ncbi:MAG: hypothetical protein ACLR3S_04360 [Clostridium fessum]
MKKIILGNHSGTAGSCIVAGCSSSNETTAETAAEAAGETAEAKRQTAIWRSW